MAHRFPFPSRGVQRWTYVVQPGDSLASISKKLSGSAENWPGLVGANQHHFETEAVDGLPYEVIKLRENEHLFVPAGWGDDSYSHEDAGQLGAPLQLATGLAPSGSSHSGQMYYDPMATFVKAIQTLAATVEAALAAMGWSAPVGPGGQRYTPADIANVLIGMLPATGLPTTPNTWDPNTLQVLYRQAAALLAQAQLPPGATDIFRSIPWTTVPWNTFPWAQVTAVATDPAQQANVWRFLIGSLQTAGYQSSQQNQSFNVPDFATIDWTTSPGIGDVPWGKIPWDKIDPTVFSHPRVQKCLAEADATVRMAEMMKHSDCFVGQGGDFFADYLCKQTDGTYKDLADCKLPELPENPPCPSPAVWDPAAKACVLPGTPTQPFPAWVSQVDWACQPSPDCIYMQMEQQVPVAQRCPPPGTAWPGCVPEWLAQYGLAVPEPKEQEKAKETNYTPVLVAVAALSTVLLVGGVIAMRNRES